MDGKNVADFIDPDIAEKLEALEREEEKLQAEGFYESEEDMVRAPLRSHPCPFSLPAWPWLQFDSDDEREAAEAQSALQHKMVSQAKKGVKNRSRLPRTAGLRTLTDLTTDLTKAGLDTSRVEQRAVMLAKVRGAQRKRKRDEDGEDMDVDDDADAAEGDWMDVDGDDAAVPSKRAKGSSGAPIAVGKRVPRSNRQLAGMRDVSVRLSPPSHVRACFSDSVPNSKHHRPCGCGTLGNGSATCTRGPARAIARLKLRWCVFLTWSVCSI